MHNNYVKINFERHQQDTERTQNRTGLEAVDSCFAIIVAGQSEVTDREALLKITRSICNELQHSQNQAISCVCERARVQVLC